MTYAEKFAKYMAGQYRFKAPPVCTAFWDDPDWIAYIDACKGWL